MNYNFEYIDIILLAMIAGFIFLRLRGILGRRTGYEENLDTNFPQNFQKKKNIIKDLEKFSFNEKEKNDFLNGAKIAYETIITDFANGNLKNIKLLLDKKVYNQFNEAIKHRKEKGLVSNTTFVGINSALIKDHKIINNILEVTVDFVSEIISCVKDKDNKILSGDPEKVKKVYDTWKFSRDMRSNNPDWLLIDTQT
tara:strand:- start:577 stop:1167 length:591 start_codon:yes stop_codon:yes gene_type:complete